MKKFFQEFKKFITRGNRYHNRSNGHIETKENNCSPCNTAQQGYLQQEVICSYRTAQNNLNQQTWQIYRVTQRK